MAAKKQSSDAVSALAARWMKVRPLELITRTCGMDGVKSVLAEIKKLAASVLAQDEIKGARKRKKA